MVAPIVDPHVPYTGHIAEGLHPGKMVRIQGIADQDGERFDINLQSGAGGEEAEQDVGLHLSVRLAEGYIARNSYQRGDWEDEQGDGDLPIGLGQRFELLILCDSNEYKIAVNGRHFCGFPFRVPYSQISYLQIKGDVHLTLISWEGTHEPSAPEDYSTKANLMNNAAPQAGYAPPPSEYVSQGVYGGPPPYGNPGATGYGAPGYGPPGYGPGAPPQGPQQQSGLESFLGSAQSAITGAIASGAAQKLLSSIMSSNKTEQSSGGFNPQNAQYGQYPHGQNMYQQYPQGAPQQPQSHGFLDSLGGQEVVGSMLSNLAGQIFSGPKGGNRF